MYGAALIESWVKLASFYQGSKGDKSDGVTQQQGRLRCLDQAVQIGRRLSNKFPGEIELHLQIAVALDNRAGPRLRRRPEQGSLPILDGVHCGAEKGLRIGESGLA